MARRLAGVEEFWFLEVTGAIESKTEDLGGKLSGEGGSKGKVGGEIKEEEGISTVDESGKILSSEGEVQEMKEKERKGWGFWKKEKQQEILENNLERNSPSLEEQKKPVS